MPTQPRIFILSLVLFLFLSSGASALENMVVNGDFETGDLTGWTSSSGSVLGSQYAYEGSYCGFIFDESAAGSWISQDVDLTGVNALTYYAMYIGCNSADILVYIDGSLAQTGAATETPYYGFNSLDVSSYSGVHTVKFAALYDEDFEIDNVEAMAEAALDYSSTSSGSLNKFYQSGYWVNEPGTIMATVAHFDNPNLDYHVYYVIDELDNSVTIADGEGVSDFLISFAESSATTKTFELYESYAYYDPALGYSVVNNTLFDTLSFDIVVRPDSTKSEIWSIGELVANQSIDFYYDIENYNSTTYDYYVSVVPSYQGQESFRNHVSTCSGFFTRELLPGSYYARLEKEINGEYILLDLYSFYIPESEPDDDSETLEPLDMPDIPNLPDDPLPDLPPLFNGTLENNETGLYNSSLLSGYYDSVDGIGNRYFQPVEGGFAFLLYPVNSLNDSVYSATVLVQNSGADMQGYTPLVSSVFTPLIGSLPPKVQGLITYNLVWMLIIMIFRRK
jgi:hypothetical protein